MRPRWVGGFLVWLAAAVVASIYALALVLWWRA